MDDVISKTNIVVMINNDNNGDNDKYFLACRLRNKSDRKEWREEVRRINKRKGKLAVKVEGRDRWRKLRDKRNMEEEEEKRNADEMEPREQEVRKIDIRSKR